MSIPPPPPPPLSQLNVVQKPTQYPLQMASFIKTLDPLVRHIEANPGLTTIPPGVIPLVALVDRDTALFSQLRFIYDNIKEYKDDHKNDSKPEVIISRGKHKNGFSRGAILEYLFLDVQFLILEYVLNKVQQIQKARCDLLHRRYISPISSNTNEQTSIITENNTINDITSLFRLQIGNLPSNTSRQAIIDVISPIVRIKAIYFPQNASLTTKMLAYIELYSYNDMADLLKQTNQLLINGVMCSIQYPIRHLNNIISYERQNGITTSCVSNITLLNNNTISHTQQLQQINEEILNIDSFLIIPSDSLPEKSQYTSDILNTTIIKQDNNDINEDKQYTQLLNPNANTIVIPNLFTLEDIKKTSCSDLEIEAYQGCHTFGTIEDIYIQTDKPIEMIPKKNKIHHNDMSDTTTTTTTTITDTITTTDTINTTDKITTANDIKKTQYIPVYIEFSTQEGAIEAQKNINGRWFSYRRLVAYITDKFPLEN